MNSYLVGATGLNLTGTLAHVQILCMRKSKTDENVRVCLLVCLNGSCYIVSIMLHKYVNIVFDLCIAANSTLFVENTLLRCDNRDV